VPAFLAPVSYAGTSPQVVVTADFNGDGQLDLATANAGDHTVSVLLGNADGTFQTAQPSATGTGPQSLAVGDFNADGKLDLVTANAEDVIVLLGNGNGTFQPATNLGVAGNAQSVAVGDFNVDGKLDLGVTSNVYVPAGYDPVDGEPYPARDEGYVNVLLGTGTGSFAAPIASELGAIGNHSFHTSAAVADFDGDGKLDFASISSLWGNVDVMLGKGNGNFWTTPGFGNNARSVAAADVNADGKIDLVTVNLNTVSVLLGNATGYFGFAAAQNYVASGNSVVLGDFNGDTRLDIATANSAGDNVSILLGRGDGTFAIAENFAAGPGATALAAGDFNGDGWLDLATTYASVLINDQSWPFVPPPASVSDVAVTEGNTGTVNATFTLTLLHASNVDVTVHYDTEDITAASGSDYQAASGDVTIPAGQTSQTFAVAVKGDRLAEPTETFAVNLSAPINGTIGDGQGLATILDNEPRISISDVTKKEGNGKKTTLFIFTVILSASYDQPVTMSYRTVDGTAKTSDNDYVDKTGTLTFAPGETTKTITIEVKGDNKKEAKEYFYLDLFGNSSNSLFTKNRGIGTIQDDD